MSEADPGFHLSEDDMRTIERALRGFDSLSAALKNLIHECDTASFDGIGFDAWANWRILEAARAILNDATERTTK
jgi:hypothetical protein